jgi:serine/threonine protein phosphatase PrpC
LRWSGRTKGRRDRERLVDLANERGGEDNITVLVARVDDAEEET